MQKKFKRAIITIVILVAVITLVLILAGLQQVSLDEYGLNYNHIMASYSDSRVYGSGLYLVGISNSLIRINKNQQTISYDNPPTVSFSFIHGQFLLQSTDQMTSRLAGLVIGELTTFTTDFYAVKALIEVSYIFNFSTADPFSSLVAFHQTMGDSPEDILEPLIKHEILIILSSKASSYYQDSTLAHQELETAIAAKVESVLASWVGSTVSVIIESLVCQGTTTNTEIIDREIQSLIHDMERVSSEQVELSEYYSALYSKAAFEVFSASAVLNTKATILQRILKSMAGSATSLAGENVTKAIYYNLPLHYDMNMVNTRVPSARQHPDATRIHEANGEKRLPSRENWTELVSILQELIEVGNRTFPY